MAVGMAKLSCDCRMANYTAILRKALDSAGFENVPISSPQTLATPRVSTPACPCWGPGLSCWRRGPSPCWTFWRSCAGRSAPMRRRQARRTACSANVWSGLPPHPSRAGQDDRCLPAGHRGIPGAPLTAPPQAPGAGHRRALVNFHPGTNFHVEGVPGTQRHGGHPAPHHLPVPQGLPGGHQRDPGLRCPSGALSLRPDGAVEFIQRFLERIARSHPLYHPAARPQDLYSDVEHFIPKTSPAARAG